MHSNHKKIFDTFSDDTVRSGFVADWPEAGQMCRLHMLWFIEEDGDDSYCCLSIDSNDLFPSPDKAWDALKVAASYIGFVVIQHGQANTQDNKLCFYLDGDGDPDLQSFMDTAANVIDKNKDS